MTKLFVLADDITGALDTAIKFVNAGALTRVITDMSYTLPDDGADVLVMNAPTRHMSAEDAYRTVYDITSRAAAMGIEYLYKKTDSALRGNVGAELSAMLAASGRSTLSFLPAFPDMKRTTVGGTQLVDGVPVHESAFGRDPFEPVTCSYIPDIIARQSGVRCEVVPVRAAASGDGIRVYDCETNAQMLETARALAAEGALRVMAGCAGCAAMLPEALGLKGRAISAPIPRGKMLVLCGSVHPVTRGQLDYAQRRDLARVVLTMEQRLNRPDDRLVEKLSRMLDAASFLAIDTNDDEESAFLRYSDEHGLTLEDVRKRVSDNLGYLLARLLERGVRATVLITGGDTLLSALSHIGCHTITPLREVSPGTVLSSVEYRGETIFILSKSGGFGPKTLFVDIMRQISAQEEGTRCLSH